MLTGQHHIFTKVGLFWSGLVGTLMSGLVGTHKPTPTCSIHILNVIKHNFIQFSALSARNGHMIYAVKWATKPVYANTVIPVILYRP